MVTSPEIILDKCITLTYMASKLKGVMSTVGYLVIFEYNV